MRSSDKSYAREDYLKNKALILDLIKRNQKERYKNHILNNLKLRLQSRLDNEVGGVDIQEVLGCSLRFCKKYIKFLLEKKLSFDNEYHIEHIRCIQSFDYKKQGFNWTNVPVLRPDENFKKGVERDYDLEEEQKKFVIDFLFNIH